MIGQRLSHFKITAKLGAGGMGEVYRDEDTKLGREVAIKVLIEAVAGDPERLAQFEREAKVIAEASNESASSRHRPPRRLLPDPARARCQVVAQGQVLSQSNCAVRPPCWTLSSH